MKNGIVGLGLLAGLAWMAGAQPAEAAVVYCKYVGYPKGCVVKAGVVLQPIVYCSYVGYPKGCVAKPGVVLAPYPARRGVVVAPVRRGGANLGGPVNRVGVR
jgi:hypothetical protein